MRSAVSLTLLCTLTLERAPTPRVLASLALPLPVPLLAAMADLILARPARDEPTPKEMTP